MVLPKRSRSRKRNRFSNYNYAQSGYYFVTICTHNFKDSFGEIISSKMKLNRYGKITRECWLDLPNHYANCQLDSFMVMPNHFHGIIVINNVGTGFKPVPTEHGLSEIVRGFKTFSSRKINHLNPSLNFSWQRSFYDHIIRTEKTLGKIREYITNNPLRWEFDRNFQDTLEKEILEDDKGNEFLKP